MADEQHASYPNPRTSAITAKFHTVEVHEAAQGQGEILLQTTGEKSQRRSTSPVGRLRGVLKSRRISNNSSSDRKSGSSSTVVSLKDKYSVEGSKRGTSPKATSVSINETGPPPVPPLPTFKTAKIDASNIDAIKRPSSARTTGPIIYNTPPTPTTENHTNDGISHEVDQSSEESKITNSIVGSPAQSGSISLRRARSASTTNVPSKLSNISTPLSPTPEAGPITPNQGGFFSTVFSAAQTAANTLSHSIGNSSTSSTSKGRSSPPETKMSDVMNNIPPKVETVIEETPVKENEPAIKTLGMGDLSLSQLGILEDAAETTISNTKFPSFPQEKPEPMSDVIIPAVSRSYTLGSNPTFDPSSTVLNETPPLNRAKTVFEPATRGDQTPPHGSVFGEKSGPQRSNSTRSGISRCRKRGGSATTNGTTIGAAIVAANSSLGQTIPNAPKITGFAVASKKRNRDFHQLFRSVPDDDYLIEDYSCALQREILAHGRLYVSEGHLCFSSNIFGWVTTLVMSFDEIISVEKRSTALLFKNGLMISTSHAKNVFASFTSRDSTYDLIIGIWKLSHPSLRSSINGVHTNETGVSDRTEKDDGNTAPGSPSGSELDSNEGDNIYDDNDEDDDDSMIFTNAEGSIAGSVNSQNIYAKKLSGGATSNRVVPENTKEGDACGTSLAIEFPGPLTHCPTECSEQENHYPRVIADELIPAPLGKIWSLVFGPASATWYRNFIIVEQKCFDYTLDENAKKPLGLDNRTRTYSYIKPLNAPIGPKQTKCMCTETLEFYDLEKSITVTISTQTPDVPSGNVFSTKTRYCFSWGANNQTRLQMNFVVEWTGKSWLKGPIEKGASDGQVQYAKDIVASLKTTVSSRRGTAAATIKSKKTRRKGKDSKSPSHTANGTSHSTINRQRLHFLEPLQQVLEALVGIIRPLLTGNIVCGIIVGLLVASWFRFGMIGTQTERSDYSWRGSPDRRTNYEELWRREERELWAWLEDRVEMDRLHEMDPRLLEQRDMDRKLRAEVRMEEREMEDAIRVTEERLQLLKKSVRAARAAEAGGSSEKLI